MVGGQYIACWSDASSRHERLLTCTGSNVQYSTARLDIGKVKYPLSCSSISLLSRRLSSAPPLSALFQSLTSWVRGAVRRVFLTQWLAGAL